MDGILLIDKESGKTSHDVVDIVRRKIRQRKVGHTGTLDPLATGLLVLCVGQATRLAEFMSGYDKEYEVLIRLGRLTETDDREGKTLTESAVDLSKDDLLTRMAELTGELKQTPPRYSAIKRKGRKLYEYAREGKEIELPVRDVRVNEFQLLEWETPFARARVGCSKGTYIRSLARDLGGSVEELRRTASGPFRVGDATKLEQPVQLLPSEAGVGHLPAVTISEREREPFRNGNTLNVSCPAPLVRVYEGDRFLGIGEPEGTGLHPRKVLV